MTTIKGEALLAATDSKVSQLTREILKQNQDSIHALLGHLKNSETLQATYQDLLNKLTDKAVSVREALEGRASPAELAETLKQAVEDNWKHIGEYIKASPIVIAALERADQLKRHLSAQLSSLTRKSTSAFRGARLSWGDLREQASAAFEAHVSSRARSMASKMFSVYDSVQDYFDRKALQDEETSLDEENKVSWLKGFMQSSFGKFLSRAAAVYGIKRLSSGVFGRLSSLFSLQGMKWLFYKSMQAALLYGAFRFVAKRTDVFEAYVKDKLTEWKDRAVVAISNAFGRLKTEVHQYAARKVNAVIDFFSDYIPDSLEEAIRPEIPKDYVDEEYTPAYPTIDIYDVLRNDTSKLRHPARSSAKQPEPSTQADFTHAFNRAVNQKAPSTTPNPAKELVETVEANSQSVFSLAGASRLLSTLGGPLSAVMAGAALLFTGQERNLQRVQETSQADVRRAARQLGTTGIGKALASLTAAMGGLTSTLKDSSLTPLDFQQGGILDGAGGSMPNTPAFQSTLSLARGTTQSGIGYNPFGPVPVRKTGHFGTFRQYYNGGRGGHHQGLDLVAADGRTTGKPLFSPLAGVVTRARVGSGYGNVVYVDHANGLQTRYGHLSAFSVREGQRIEAGQEIGKAGNTGRSSGPHLHYETRINGKAVDPATVNYSAFGRMRLEDGHGLQNHDQAGKDTATSQPNPPAPPPNLARPIPAPPPLLRRPAAQQDAVVSRPIQPVKQAVQREPIYTEDTWKQYKEALREPEKESNPSASHSLPPTTTTKASNEIRIPYKSPFNVGMSELLLSEYIG